MENLSVHLFDRSRVASRGVQSPARSFGDEWGMNINKFLLYVLKGEFFSL